MPSPLNPGNKQPAEHQEAFPAMDNIGSEHAGEAPIRNTVAGTSNTTVNNSSSDRALLLQILSEIQELKRLITSRSSSGAKVGKFG